MANGQAVMHYSRHRLTTSAAYVLVLVQFSYVTLFCHFFSLCF